MAVSYELILGKRDGGIAPGTWKKDWGLNKGALLNPLAICIFFHEQGPVSIQGNFLWTIVSAAQPGRSDAYVGHATLV